MNLRTLLRNAAFALFAAAAVSGCDFLDMFSQKRSQERAALRDANGAEPTVVERPREQAGSQRALLMYHVESRLRLLKSSIAGIDRDGAELTADRSKLSASLSKLVDKFAEDKAMPPSAALSLTLKDDCVNAMALKYLGEDFAAMRSEYVEKIRNLELQEKQREEAIERNKAEYEAALSAFDASAGHRREANKAAAARLGREISETEKRLRRLRSNPPPSGRVYNAARIEHSRSTQMLDRELSQLRDDLRKVENDMRNDDSARKREQARLSALRDKRNADAKIPQVGGKNGMSADAITADFRARSLGLLDSTLKKKDDSIRWRRSLVVKQIAFLESSTNGIDRLDLAGLKTVKGEIDRELAKIDSMIGDGDAGKK